MEPILWHGEALWSYLPDNGCQEKCQRCLFAVRRWPLQQRVSSKYWPQSRPLLLSFVSHVCDLKCINWQTSLLDKKWSRKNCFVCAVSANINYKVDSSILVTFQSCEILISLDNFFFWPLMLLHLILLFSWTLLSSIYWFFFWALLFFLCHTYMLFSINSTHSALLLRAQERPATLILTVTSGLRIMRACHVYNREAQTGSWKFVLQLRMIRMRKMCQSEQFVTWDPGFCHVEDQRTFFADVIACDSSFCHMDPIW